ncbi:immobilization antigen isoform, putative [Ichthyophthirius multifiliis]|uniref:Immobilization antigen isoform, putative n=1 Tax=Ichthyophthirius multifiliis TaxID=5932 RepID=G0R6B8_ICHMU|nr:immobilization antigen isoform, putative [Ichthyophthirius multifiliis]EGR26990.1 immobilization antigen isoform, putative [Ichthyophthirius multifiliis]|eukprot:XP_004023874.1 immobilization antigen isoform, putative [Ichthyophthirius multifiliis]
MSILIIIIKNIYIQIKNNLLYHIYYILLKIKSNKIANIKINFNFKNQFVFYLKRKIYLFIHKFFSFINYLIFKKKRDQKMKYLIIFISLLFINQLRAVKCPAGSQTDAGSDQVAAENNLPECTKCKLNFYYAGASPLAAGNAVNGICTQCPQNKIDSVATLGSEATIAKQCDISCPPGTVLDDGVIQNYVKSPAECTKCLPNYFQSVENNQIVEAKTCAECSYKLPSGAQARIITEATRKVQCGVAQFLSISLLFISFYLL